MISATVKLRKMGTTLVCSHVAEGARPTGQVILRYAGYVRLCAQCSLLAHRPGALKYQTPALRRQEAKANPHRRHIDAYIAEHTA